jgi:RNA polymerase sigma factor (sigma-70 family)
MDRSKPEEAQLMGAARAVTAPLRATNESIYCKSIDWNALSDTELLARFFREKDDAAFSTLVARHGPLVFGVCRRVLNDANDAEDALQATFLVLVRKGATLRDPERLASWLYGVAYRTARKVRAKAIARTKSERQAGEMPSKSDSDKSTRDMTIRDMTYEELQAVLDEEISKLPEKYALPLVLCYLEGKTNAQAAAQLGWPEGSISRRLSRARELLRSRLAKRGMAMSVALIAAVFAKPASSAISQELLLATTRAAALAAEGAELEEVASPAVARLATEMLASMSAATKFAIPTAIIVASVLAILTAAVFQVSPSAYAASLFNFSRGLNVHGLTTTPTSAQTLALPGDSTGAQPGACGSACGTPAPCGSAP